MSGSGFDFLSVLEGEADIILSVDRGVVHQPVPAVECEFRQLIRQLFECFEEGFIAGSLGFLFVDLSGDRLKLSFGFLKPLGEAVVAFLVFSLIQSNMGILIKNRPLQNVQSVRFHRPPPYNRVNPIPTRENGGAGGGALAMW